MAEKESTSQAEVTEVHNEEVTPTEGQQEQGDGGEGEKPLRQPRNPKLQRLMVKMSGKLGKESSNLSETRR